LGISAGPSRKKGQDSAYCGEWRTGGKEVRKGDENQGMRGRGVGGGEFLENNEGGSEEKTQRPIRRWGRGTDQKQNFEEDDKRKIATV